MSVDPERSAVGDGTSAPERSWTDAAREDFLACIDARLHWIVAGIFVPAMTVVGATMALVSEAMYATGDLPGTIRLFTTNGAWLFTSLVALVGLFVGYPVFATDRTDDPSPRPFVGRLASRWALVGGGVLAGFVAFLVVAVVAYDPFSPATFAAFAVVTAALALAYVSLGVAVSAAASTPRRAVGWLLGAYFFLAFLWDTWILPLGFLLVVSGGNPEALAARPGWFDWLVASSPGGAYATIGDVLVDGSSGLLWAYAVACLLAWIVVPAVVGAFATRR